MDPVVLAESPDKPGAEPSFRKPVSDAANRKYRRHSPLGGADSSSSGGSPKRDRSHSPVISTDQPNKITGNHWQKDNGRGLERDSSHHRSGRGDDSRRHSDRSSNGNSQDYQRYDGNGRYERSSQSGRESRGGSRYDHGRYESHPNRSRDNWRDVDRYSRDKPDVLGDRTKEKERESTVQEHYRTKDRDYERTKLRDSERTAPGSRHINSIRDDFRTGERGKYTDREDRDDTRGRHKSPSYRSDLASHDLVGRDGDFLRSKESHRRSNKEMDGHKEDLLPKRKHDDRETEKRKERYTREPREERQSRSSRVSTYRERDEKNEWYKDSTITEDPMSSPKKLKLSHSEDEKPSSSAKPQVSETTEVATSKPVNSITNQADTGDLNAAKVAAMKAAELVNKNLVGGAYMSTDQKKKLLWGNKKSTIAEVSQPTNRWDLQLFADRERQEKFNKLMSLRLPWYIWPIVGCEGRPCSGAENGRQRCGEAEGDAEHGPGEAVHCRAAEERWPNSRSWAVMAELSVLVCIVLNLFFPTIGEISCKRFDVLWYLQPIMDFWLLSAGLKDFVCSKL